MSKIQKKYIFNQCLYTMIQNYIYNIRVRVVPDIYNTADTTRPLMLQIVHVRAIQHGRECCKWLKKLIIL